MAQNYQKYIKHLASIIQTYEGAPRTNQGRVFSATAHGTLARAENIIKLICDENSPYRVRMNEIVSERYTDEAVQADLVVGIVKALKGELDDGYLDSFPELVRGELFGDFVEMAEHLLSEGYKDAAAVIAGSALESHLHQLSLKQGLSLEYLASDGSTKRKKADRLNNELATRKFYSKLDQKQITAWLDLRNSAAHGQYSNYSDIQVASFIEWERDFIAKNPA
jgi:hypothetical protein